MEELLKYILDGILGAGNYELEQKEDMGRLVFSVKTGQENIGLLIGKGGHMIKSLRNVLKVRATLEKKAVALNIGE